jgi:PAS domain S-box-containing protein
MSVSTVESEGSEHVVASLRDLRDRKRLEADQDAQSKASRDRDERVRWIAQSSPDVMFFQDADLRWQWIVNSRPPFTEETTLGRTDAEIFPSVVAAVVTQVKRNVLASGKTARITFRHPVEGRTHWFDTTITPAHDQSGQVCGVFGYSRDISDRIDILGESAGQMLDLEVERARLQAMVDNSLTPLYFVES